MFRSLLAQNQVLKEWNIWYLTRLLWQNQFYFRNYLPKQATFGEVVTNCWRFTQTFTKALWSFLQEILFKRDDDTKACTTYLLTNTAKLFKKWPVPASFIVYFRVFSKKHNFNYYNKNVWKNVHHVYCAWIRTHDPRNLSVLP